jgi:hypothetical protein
MIKVKQSSNLRPALRLAVIGMLLTSTSGCMSLENEEGRLPDAMRAAISNLSAKGFPDLTKIPDAPQDLPSTSTWKSLESGLVAQGKSLAANPGAVAPTAEETNLDWAETQRRALNADPRAEPVPPVPIEGSDEVRAAAAAKAKLDADLARLPPP